MHLRAQIRCFVWDLVQWAIGVPEFKRQVYGSVLRPPGRLLDFGCATGHIAMAFCGFEYYGIDLDVAAINYAKAKFSRTLWLHFVAVDITERPFPEGYFDQVLIAGTLHHIADPLVKQIVGALHYCLKPGGWTGPLG